RSTPPAAARLVVIASRPASTKETRAIQNRALERGMREGLPPCRDTFTSGACRGVARFALFCTKFESSLLHRVAKMSAKIRPPIAADAESRRRYIQNCVRRVSRGDVRAIHATLSRKGSFVPVI